MNDVLWRGREVWRGDVTFLSEHVGVPTHTASGKVSLSLYGDRGVDTHKWEPTG